MLVCFEMLLFSVSAAHNPHSDEGGHSTSLRKKKRKGRWNGIVNNNNHKNKQTKLKIFQRAGQQDY